MRQNAERIQLPPVEQPAPGPDEESLRDLLGLLRARTRFFRDPEAFSTATRPWGASCG